MSRSRALSSLCSAAARARCSRKRACVLVIHVSALSLILSHATYLNARSRNRCWLDILLPRGTLSMLADSEYPEPDTKSPKHRGNGSNKLPPSSCSLGYVTCLCRCSRQSVPQSINPISESGWPMITSHSSPASPQVDRAYTTENDKILIRVSA
jgi:hypothetical protein